MKKLLFIAILSICSIATQAQAVSGLKITTPMPISEDLALHSNITIKTISACVDSSGKAEIIFLTKLEDGTNCTAPYIGHIANIDSCAYNWTPAYLLLKAFLEKQNLTVQTQ